MARKAGLRKQRAKALAQVEWSFDKIPAGELLPCLHYEYARDATWIHDDLNSNQRDADNRLLVLPMAVKMMLAATNGQGFPVKPWMKLSKNIRNEAVEWFRSVDFSVQTEIGFGDSTQYLIKQEVSGGPRISNLIQCQDTDGFEIRIFRFNWTLSPEQFGDLCKEWFEKNQPLEFKAVAGRRSKYRAPGFRALLYPPIEALKYLGVKRRWERLPKGSGWTEFNARWPNDYPLDGKRCTDSGTKRSRISQCCSHAQKMLDSLYPKSPGPPPA